MVVISSAAALGSTLLGVASTVTVATVAVGLAAQVALGAALRALSPKPQLPKATPRGYTVTQRGSALDHQIIYGRAKAGGVIVYTGTTGGENKKLHQVIAFTGHEIESFDEIFLNDARVTGLDEDGFVTGVSGGEGSSDRYNNKVRIKQYLGTTDQTADPDLVSEVSEWTNEHRLREIAYLYVRYDYDEDAFPTGVPEIRATIKGKKVYDPRDGTTAWSDNPALCLRDYLTSEYGLGEEESNIDDDLVITAANVCDQTVLEDTLFVNGSEDTITQDGSLGDVLSAVFTILGKFPVISYLGGFFNTLITQLQLQDDLESRLSSTRYTCNGNITTGATPTEIITDLLTSMGGTLWYAQGKWRMKPAYWTEPTVEFTEDDLRSSVSVRTRHSRRDNFSTVRGTYRGEETDWQLTDYPEVTAQAFVDADGGLESAIDVELPFTDTSIEARRHARIVLERNRQQLTVSASFGLKAFQVQVGDIIQLTLSRFGWSQKEFEVVGWTFGLTDGLDLQVQLTLREISESVFDEVLDGKFYEKDNTTLVSAFDVPEVGLTLSTDLKLAREEVFGVISVQVDSSNDLASLFEVQYKKSSATNYLTLGFSETPFFEINIAEDATYDIRARAINALGVKGAWATVSDFEARPFAEPPEQVTDLSITPLGSTAILSWSAVTDLDLSHYVVRYNPATSGAKYSESIILVPKVARPATSVTVPLRDGTYFIKAVDKQGIESTDSASISTNISSIDNLNFVSVISEEDTVTPFNGTKTNMTATTDGSSDPILILAGGTLFDDASGNFDDASGQFDTGFGVVASGTYEYASNLDLGASYECVVSSDLTFTSNDLDDLLDAQDGLFDLRVGDFDGSSEDNSFLSVRNQVSYTQDDPAGSPTWSDWEDFLVKGIKARGFRFRTLVSTTTSSVTPYIYELGATIDMPDRVISGEDITFTGSTSVTFTDAFYTGSTPALGISLAGLSTGDYYEITNKDNTGFDITVYDSTDTQLATSVELDYVAKGYGRIIT